MPRCVLYQGFREPGGEVRVERMVFSANEVANVSRWSREGWRITTGEILAWRRDLEKSTGSMLPVGLEKKLRP